MRITFSVLFLLFMIRGGWAADRVSTEDGRIVLEDSLGKKTALTQTGFDSDPWISPDARTVVFLRHAADDMFRTSVYEIDIRTRTVRLLYPGPAKYHGRESSYFGRPELGESGNTLYLLSNRFATEADLISIRLASGQIKLISDHVVGYDVAACPKYRGDLIALKRHNDEIIGRPYFLYWLYSATGEELGMAGVDQEDVDVLRDAACEVPQSLPAPAPVPSRPLTAAVAVGIRMEESEMDGRLVTRVEPTYPNQARSEHIQGDVRLQVRVGADGSVQDIILVSGHPRLVQAAIAAVKQWKYRPVVSAGHPVAVVTMVTVRFRLP
jgi:TonB family protein